MGSISGYDLIAKSKEQAERMTKYMNKKGLNTYYVPYTSKNKKYTDIGVKFVIKFKK